MQLPSEGRPTSIITGSTLRARVAIELVSGNIVAQDTDAIVNAWNRNIIPWWLLLPQGVSRAIKRTAGTRPFRDLSRVGPIPLGGAVATASGRMQAKAIVHVAGIDMFWRASHESIQGSVHNGCNLAIELGIRTIAFPVVGSGSGGLQADEALEIMLAVLDPLRDDDPDLRVTIVRFP